MLRLAAPASRPQGFLDEGVGVRAEQPPVFAWLKDLIAPWDSTAIMSWLPKPQIPLKIPLFRTSRSTWYLLSAV
ncbi:MAG: hypothetical protein ACRDNW_01190 [Trebonia sp.]